MKTETNTLIQTVLLYDYEIEEGRVASLTTVTPEYFDQEKACLV